ncbi:hypothetical protein AAG570_013712 [Ranatra chinensis]|uniref:Cytochrome P450 n=1 Tax=Ranatra chinensis TaxID=642074 RepID=A0ABD0YD60_9HEMI
MTLISARDLSLVVVATCLVLWLYLRHKFSYWKERGVPYEKPHILFGNMKDVFLLRKTESQVMDRLYKEFKGHPYFGVYYLWRPVLVVTDTDLIKAFYSIINKDK